MCELCGAQSTNSDTTAPDIRSRQVLRAAHSTACADHIKFAACNAQFGVVAFFATTLAGGVFVPINPVLKAAQVQHILNDCNIAALISSSAQVAALSETLDACPALRQIITVDEISAKPKGVVLSHRNMVMGATSVAGYIMRPNA